MNHTDQKLSEWDDIIVGVGMALLILLLCVGSTLMDTIFLSLW